MKRARSICVVLLGLLAAGSGCAELQSMGLGAPHGKHAMQACRRGNCGHCRNCRPQPPTLDPARRTIAEHAQPMPPNRSGSNRPLRDFPLGDGVPAPPKSSPLTAQPASADQPHRAAHPAAPPTAEPALTATPAIPARYASASVLHARPASEPSEAHGEGFAARPDLYAPQGRIELRLSKSGQGEAPRAQTPPTLTAENVADIEEPADNEPLDESAATQTAEPPASLPADAAQARPLTAPQSTTLSMPSGDGRVARVTAVPAEQLPPHESANTAQPAAWIHSEPVPPQEKHTTPANQLRTPSTATQRTNALRLK